MGIKSKNITLLIINCDIINCEPCAAGNLLCYRQIKQYCCECTTTNWFLNQLIKPQKSKLKGRASTSSSCLAFSFLSLSLFNTYTHGTSMSAFRPSVHAYQSLWYIQAGDKLPRAWSAPSQPVWRKLIGGLLSRLSLTAACCSPPALFILVSVTK